MLYQTHHHFPSSATSFSSSLQVQTEMECVKTALKASVRKEVVMKSSPHVLLDDFNVPNGVSFDDSFVDEYLNFSNEDGCFVHGDREEEDEEHDTVQEEHCKNSHHFRDFSVKDDFAAVPASELGVPADDLENLEWLSHFVDDSYSDYSSPFPAGPLPLKPKIEETCCEPEKAVRMTVSEACFKTPVPAKARSKRTRTGVRVWPLGSPSLTESSSSSTTSSSSSPPNLWFIHAGKVQPGSMEKPRVKRQKKTRGAEWVQPPRRCSHCGVQKTPQWRAGPVGAKTLCNACGVRFKSGRLFPEYRPACSPTFSSELHSNNHRKVLEMRKKKDMVGRVDPPPAVPSF